MAVFWQPAGANVCAWAPTEASRPAGADSRVFAGRAQEEGRMLGKCLAWRILAGKQAAANIPRWQAHSLSCSHSLYTASVLSSAFWPGIHQQTLWSDIRQVETQSCWKTQTGHAVFSQLSPSWVIHHPYSVQPPYETSLLWVLAVA